MPKKEIDYSNTIIYKIYCKDSSIGFIYVGHTTNFTQRKFQHKNRAKNMKNTINLYDAIQCNGGWDNWDMIEIEKYDCKDIKEARQKEQEHYDAIISELNSNFDSCDDKHEKCTNLSNDSDHSECEISYKIPKNSFSNKKTQNFTPVFLCKICDFTSSNKNDYSRHLQTKKHLSNKWQHLATFKQQKNSLLICENCHKQYKNRTGLWRHKKNNNCESDENEDYEVDKVDLPSDKELIMHLIKDNAEMRKMMMIVVKNGTNNINCNNTTNKMFNLNLYLNETCKDAMNISDFVSSIKFSLEDLENTGRKGYVEGISNIFLKNLNNVEHHMRPIHCGDLKREILYIKDNNKWEKECEKKTILTKAIKNVANENIKQIKNWRNKNPDCITSESRKNDLYLKIVSNSMNGLTEEEGKKNINKIISNVAREVVIDKNNT